VVVVIFLVGRDAVPWLDIERTPVLTKGEIARILVSRDSIVV
jgi:hypothetical protein